MFAFDPGEVVDKLNVLRDAVGAGFRLCGNSALNGKTASVVGLYTWERLQEEVRRRVGAGAEVGGEGSNLFRSEAGTDSR